jgi:serine protease AprX
MAKMKVLVELQSPAPERQAFELFAAMTQSVMDMEREASALLAPAAGLGVEIDEQSLPVPLLGAVAVGTPVASALAAFAAPTTNPDMSSETIVVPCEVDRSKADELRSRPGITVWPNSPLTLFQQCQQCHSGENTAFEEAHTLDLARSAGGLDCRPYRAGVPIPTIRELLGVQRVWDDGFRGQNIIVGIIDEGVNGNTYPVVGGFSRPEAGQRWGTAPVTSHGSMCAADILVAAPTARLYDYPFLGVPNSGGALTMFQAVLDQRRRDGTPQLTNNSYGFVGVPDQNLWPNHEVWDINHPLHRKIREVIASGAACFFAAGNCGQNCPSGNCDPSGIGPGRSIHGSNSLVEVITVAAVNSQNERVGYSSQGPGMFEPNKPDISSYTHFFGNFGPGRPGGTAQPFDNGTSAATPVAAGVGALLLSAFNDLAPEQLKALLMETSTEIGSPGWDAEHGQGVINAAAAYISRVRGGGAIV